MLANNTDHRFTKIGLRYTHCAQESAMGSSVHPLCDGGRLQKVLGWRFFRGNGHFQACTWLGSARGWRNQINDKSRDNTIRNTEPSTKRAVISVSRFSNENLDDSF